MTRLKAASGLEFDVEGDGPYHWQLYRGDELLECGNARTWLTLAWKLARAERRALRPS